MAQTELSVQTLARSGWIVSGLLLLLIGLSDVVVGRTKLAQYQTVLRQTPVTRPEDPAALFPKVTEADEQRSVARTKLGFYNLLFLTGQVITLTGLVLCVFGLVRIRRRGSGALARAGSR